jgi:hypothetical protein
MYVDEKLDWKKQVEKRAENSKRKVNAMERLTGTRWDS